jgi:AcrR family transcriptional regulator
MEISEYKIDRRVARTRKSLHQALISLILEKGYDSITVDEICQRLTQKDLSNICILRAAV